MNLIEQMMKENKRVTKEERKKGKLKESKLTEAPDAYGILYDDEVDSKYKKIAQDEKRKNAQYRNNLSQLKSKISAFAPRIKQLINKARDKGQNNIKVDLNAEGMSYTPNWVSASIILNSNAKYYHCPEGSDIVLFEYYSSGYRIRDIKVMVTSDGESYSEVDRGDWTDDMLKDPGYANTFALERFIEYFSQAEEKLNKELDMLPDKSSVTESKSLKGKRKLKESNKDDILSLATDDYQHRRGDYPRSGVPDTINVWERSDGNIEVDADFKNTSESTAESWLKRYVSSSCNCKIIDSGAYQDGDYHDDWVSAYVIVEGQPEGDKSDGVSTDIDYKIDVGYKDDKVFLLSIEEYKKYKSVIPGVWHWYWLRSPGSAPDRAAYASRVVKVDGHFVDYSGFLVRPALKLLDPEFSNLQIGDTLDYMGIRWTKIDEGLFIVTGALGYQRFDADSNDYETSEIRQYLLSKFS